MKQNLQPLLSLILSSLADLSQVTDLHSERGTIRDLRFYFLILTLGGAFTLLVLGALVI